MADDNAKGAVVNKEAAPRPKASDTGKGLADYGYSRQGYLDRTELDKLLEPPSPSEETGGESVSTPEKGFKDKLNKYAKERLEWKQEKIEHNISNYLADPKSNRNTVNLYKDLYDAYLATKPDDPLSRESYLRQLTNVSSQLTPRSTGKALDSMMGTWSDDPAAFLNSTRESGIGFKTGAESWASSAAIGDMFGWDSAAYDRSYNATGLEGFASRSRTVKAREEAARKAREEALRNRYRRRSNSSERGQGGSSIGGGGSRGGGGIGGLGHGGGDAGSGTGLA